MKTKGMELEELRALVATLDAVQDNLSRLSSMRSRNGSYCILSLVSLDEKEVHLLCQKGYMDGEPDDWEAFDTQSVCHVPLSLLMNKDLPLDVRAGLARGWTEVETEEEQQRQKVAGNGLTSVTTNITSSKRADEISNSGHDREPDPAPEAH